MLNINILLASGWVYPATHGVSGFIARMEKKYREMGHHVEVVSLKPGDVLENKRYYFHDPVKFIKYADAIDFEPDVIHANDVYSAKELHDIYPDVPIVLTVHNVLCQEAVIDGEVIEGSAEWHNIRQVEMDGINSADIVVFVSRGQRDNFLNEYKDEYPKDKKTLVVYNGIDGSAYINQRHVKNPVPVIISVGRLSGIKGYSYLLDALASLKDTQWELRLIGDGPERENLEEQAVKLDISDRVKFYGSRSDIPALLSEADIYVQPSLLEGLPTTIIEAMFAGLPIVATEVGGIPEQVDSSFGILVSPANSAELKDALLIMLRTSRKGQAGIRAREKAMSLFNLDICAQKYIFAASYIRKEKRTEVISNG